MAELVDALVSGTSAARRGGSSPLLGTKRREKPAISRLFSFTVTLAGRLAKAPRERACTRTAPSRTTFAGEPAPTDCAIRSGAKRVTTQDGFVALGTSRDHVDRNLADLLDAVQVGTRLLRQRVPTLRAEGGAGPALHGLVDRLAARDLLRTHRQQVDALAVEHVAGAQLQLFEPVEHVELGDAQPGDAVDDDRALERSEVQPAAAALAAGEG